MREAAVDHVGDGLESAVRMPVGAPRFTRLVLDLAHLVHVHERVEVGGAHSGERAHDGKALALVSVRAGGDGADWAFGVGRRGCADPRKGKCVSGDSRHVTINRTVVRIISASSPSVGLSNALGRETCLNPTLVS